MSIHYINNTATFVSKPSHAIRVRSDAHATDLHTHPLSKEGHL